jgi:putative membrane protein
MKSSLLELYLWIKALHIIAVIAWMAGMFYLPRLFVYHTQTTAGTTEYERFATMERKLLKIIMGPAMIVTWVMGLTMAWLMNDWADGWLSTKLLLVVAMTAVDHLYRRWAKKFAAGANVHSERFFRLWNEVPTVLMIGIVILVVVKPF